jgi:hypothetical protein
VLKWLNFSAATTLPHAASSEEFVFEDEDDSHAG